MVRQTAGKAAAKAASPAAAAAVRASSCAARRGRWAAKAAPMTGHGPGEDARVPQVPPAGQEGLRPRRVRLLHEAQYPAALPIPPFGGRDRLAQLDVAEARLRRRGRDADGGQPAGPGQGRGLAQVCLQGLGRGDLVVGGQDDHDRLRILGAQPGHAQAQSGRGAQGRRFAQHLPGRHLRQLCPHLRHMVRRGQDDDPLGGHQGRQAVHRQAQHRTLRVGEGQELLGRMGLGQRPKPRSGAAGQDEGVEGWVLMHDAIVRQGRARGELRAIASVTFPDRCLMRLPWGRTVVYARRGRRCLCACSPAALILWRLP